VPFPQHLHPLKNEEEKKQCIFCVSGECGCIDYGEYFDHEYLDHDYILFGYLDVNINDKVYNYTLATTLVNNVHVITCVHDIAVVTTGGKRRHHKEKKTIEAHTSSLVALHFTPATTKIDERL
jgi:hypothetical protein